MKEEVFRLQGRLETEHWWFRARREILVDIGSQLLPESGTVLDIGCGTGGNISAFSCEHVRVGVDPSESAIEIARTRDPNVKFVCGVPPQAILAELRAADLVLLNDVLEHVEEDQGLLRGLVEEMKVGANVLLTVPAHPDLWSAHDVSHGHYRRYTEETLARLWLGLPVETRLFAWFNRRLYPVARTVRAVKQRLNLRWGAEGTDLDLPPRLVNWILYRIFRGEGGALKDTLRAENSPRRARGLSLLAILRRDRIKPDRHEGI
jgi:SAM-dependent methyltransferase